MSNLLYDIEHGKLTLHLHAGQTKAWDSEKRFVFVIAGTQGGKTSFCSAPGGYGERCNVAEKVITWW